MLNAIIQHNFTSGLGDCVVAMKEYTETAKTLTRMNYDVHLKVYTSNNKYYQNLNIFDLIDLNSFSMFKSIEHIDTPLQYIENYRVAHLSYGAQTPGAHWWDLFVDSLDPIKVVTFPQNYYFYDNITVYSNDLLFTNNVLKYSNNITNNNTYASIYLRTYDYENTLTNNIDMSKIDKLYHKYSKVFVCSNSYTVKKHIIDQYPKKSLSIDLPLQDTHGAHFGSNYGIDNNLAKDRTFISLAEMHILSLSQKIAFYPGWNRMSNFLFNSCLNNIPIEII